MEDKTISEARDTLGSLLRLSYEMLQARVYGRLAELGYDDIRPAHSSVFRYIKPGGSRVSDLAERAQMTKQSMAYLVASLQELGYVVIGPDPDDGRAKQVILTDRGHAVWDSLVLLSAEAEKRGVERIGKVDIEHLRVTLRALAEALEP